MGGRVLLREKLGRCAMAAIVSLPCGAGNRSLTESRQRSGNGEEEVSPAASPSAWPATPTPSAARRYCAEACQSPMDRFFDPGLMACQSPFTGYLTSGTTTVLGGAPPVMVTPATSYTMPASAVPMPPRGAFGIWPGGVPPQQMWPVGVPLPCATVSGDNNVASILPKPGSSGGSVASDAAPAEMAASNSAPHLSTTSTRDAMVGAQVANLGRKVAADLSVKRGSAQTQPPGGAQGNRLVPVAVYVDLSCLRERKVMHALSGTKDSSMCAAARSSNNHV